MSIFEINYWYEKWARVHIADQAYNREQMAKYKELTG